jgi:VWFA-related protein
MKALFFVMIVAAAGQAPRADNGSPVNNTGAQPETVLPYRTGTRVVEITVAATIAGQKADDLQAADLKLFDNGKEQAIASFEKLGQGGPHAKRHARLYVIVLDSVNTPWSEDIYAREGVSRMLSKLPPGDRIAIFGLDGSLRLLHDFSNDYAALRSAVDNYPGAQPPDGVAGWHPYPANVADAFDTGLYPFHSNAYPYGPPMGFEGSSPVDGKYPFDRRFSYPMNNALAFATTEDVSSPEAFDARAVAPFDAHTTGAFNVGAAASFADFDQTGDILYTLQSLRRIGQLTKSYPGPKSILWVSSGFPTQVKTYLAGAAVPEFFHVETAQAMRELEQDNAVLYPISPDGLDWTHVQSMQEMAEQAGGRVFYNSNDVAGLVRSARDDMSNGYVLTFVPKDYQADGTVHQLRIQSSRPDVQLRYRTVYMADSTNAEIRPATFSTFGSPTVVGVVDAGNGDALIAPNTWVVIKGSNLAPDSRVWRLADVENNRLPTQLDGVGVTMNEEAAYVYSISPGEVKVLTPPDLAPGPVHVKVTLDGNTSAEFTVQGR